MRSVTYSMNTSLDGYIVGPDGGFDWSAPNKEVFRFWIDEIREVGVHLMGRRLYETMLYWETADQDHSLDDAELEWAALWNPLPKVVFSTTLSAVQGAARLASGGLAEEIERLRAEPGEGEIAIGGATLAAEAAALVAFRSFPGTSAGWSSNWSRPAPSARSSSTSATAWRASRAALPVAARPVAARPVARPAAVDIADSVVCAVATAITAVAGRLTPAPSLPAMRPCTDRAISAVSPVRCSSQLAVKARMYPYRRYGEREATR
jgi:dihydrofolate reductase